MGSLSRAQKTHLLSFLTYSASRSILKRHVSKSFFSTATSDPESSSSADFNKHLLSFDPKEIKFGIEFEPFIFPGTWESAFEDGISAPRTLEEPIVDSSNEESIKSYENLTLDSDKQKTSSFLSSEKNFAPVSGLTYSEDKTSTSTLQISSTSDLFSSSCSNFYSSDDSFESSPFDSSNLPLTD